MTEGFWKHSSLGHIGDNAIRSIKRLGKKNFNSGSIELVLNWIPPLQLVMLSISILLGKEKHWCIKYLVKGYHPPGKVPSLDLALSISVLLSLLNIELTIVQSLLKQWKDILCRRSQMDFLITCTSYRGGLSALSTCCCQPDKYTLEGLYLNV